MLSKGVLLLDDNARPHTSRMPRDLIESFGLGVFDTASYSSDLAPSDFHLFRSLKHSLGGKICENGRELLAVRPGGRLP
ncbi:hypothetical protein TNCV_3193531 [Trichonephila clavipes]|nr:hypothetical protein TNCV_3193531 [Trichonephila clavipes]